jgi:hypothetical protein
LIKKAKAASLNDYSEFAKSACERITKCTSLCESTLTHILDDVKAGGGMFGTRAAVKIAMDNTIVRCKFKEPYSGEKKNGTNSDGNVDDAFVLEAEGK